MSPTATNTKKTLTFFGASTGCGLSALQHALKEGHMCIALCRTPSKLTERFPAAVYPNLTVIQGNAHDISAVSKCLVHPADPKQFVDQVVSSIGGAFDARKFTIDDPHVCERGMETLLQAVAEMRAGGASGGPLIIVLSTTGISKAGRDLPVVMWAFYRSMLGVPHRDKAAMEEKLAGSGEAFVVVRPSFLSNEAKPERRIRVGVEDISGGKHVLEKKEFGYTISRADVGRWIFENLLRGGGDEYKNGPLQYKGKAVSLTW
jgi:NAD(P)-dependent dehydrogenase (short-subunit alcohol dehydrogenase family)